MTDEQIIVAAHHTPSGQISVRCSCDRALVIPSSNQGRTCRGCDRFVFIHWFSDDNQLAEIVVTD